MQTRAWSGASWLILLGILAGCGQGSARLPVSGKITGSGADQLEGSISFIPAKGNEGQGATCMLKGGAYAFDRASGPTAGPYQVSIRRTPSKPTSGQMDRQTRQEWNFEAEVPAAGPYTVDFDLDSSPP